MKFFYKENVLQQIDAAVKAVMEKRLIPKIVWVNNAAYERLMREHAGSCRYRRVMLPLSSRNFADVTAAIDYTATTVEYEIRCRSQQVERIYVETVEPLPTQVMRGIDDAAIKNREIDYIELSRQELDILTWQLGGGYHRVTNVRDFSRGQYMTLFGTRIELEGNCSL